MSKKEKRIPASEYTDLEWYTKLMKSGWFVADWDANADELICRRLDEWYGDITAQQASIMKYRTIWELNTNQIRTLLGKDYKQEEWKDWEQERKQPLREYEEWLLKQK